MAAASVLALAGCSDFLNMCRNDVLADVHSPSGERHAVVFQRDCGATTGFGVQVSILRRGKALPNEAGNTFTADANHDAGVSLDVQPIWESDRVLRLTHDDRLRTFTRERSVAGVEIVYQPSPAR
ncbi:hypothetical protein Adeh_3906 [Anaeromyxobacter dehalogenans 2CP-C]|uniref:Uncharacterized protein n=2 Tax=Anaeromyxobacter dehalogenans TaxID=161493 RepID=Q2IGG2_ANADE|nr:hypothetical protein Adeh_3906 [Anaeromyxobacter dehalogenans 2CP-C]